MLKKPFNHTEAGISLCRKHHYSLDVYCCTDEQVICAVCASEKHRGHTFGLVKEERKRKQAELINMKRRSNEFLLSQEEIQNQKVEILKHIEDKARETDDHCESILAGVIDSLQRHYSSVRELIGMMEQRCAAQVQDSTKNLKLKKKQMKKRYADLDHLAHTDNDVEFLLKWPRQRHLCEKDLCEFSEDSLLPFESIKKAVEQLGSQLETFCDNEFAKIIQTATSESQQETREGTEDVEEEMQQRCEATTPVSYVSTGLFQMTQQIAEPKTREDFLKYACELTLDPATAHEDLHVSKCDKEVRLCPLTLKGPALRNPERFLHRRQLLCREALQAERCYYEVEVTGGKAEIALAYNGIDRKSRTTLSAFGGNANSWSLDRSTNYSVSHKSDSIQLMTPPSCDRVGVYLKFREGTLSFYEVSHCMTFLYKVEATFTEPLYPGFWLGEKCLIRICDLKNT